MSVLKVLFIGGAGRSGSTLLETLLGQINGVVSVGEIDAIWNSGFVENNLCGCGCRFLECKFWKSVFDTSFVGVDQVDEEKFIEIQHGAGRHRHIPKMVWPRLSSDDFCERLRALRSINATLFDGIRQVSDAQVIVDSSKGSSRAYMLCALDNIELHIVQLVRDSRAVAHSWQRRKIVPDAQRGNPEMMRMTTIQSTFDWTMRHFFLGAITNLKNSNIKSHSIVRYEDLVSSPISVLSSLASCLGLETDLDALFESPTVAFRKTVTHTIEGNPSKFSAGNLDIRIDSEWKHAMRPFDRALVSVLTAPYLKKFGYI